MDQDTAKHGRPNPTPPAGLAPALVAAQLGDQIELVTVQRQTARRRV